MLDQLGTDHVIYKVYIDNTCVSINTIPINLLLNVFDYFRLNRTQKLGDYIEIYYNNKITKISWPNKTKITD